MKFNTLFVAAICAGSLMTSCVHDTAKENQLKFTHTSLVDGDAFAYIQTVGETALDGVKYAEYAEKSGDAKAVEIASQVKAFYTQLLPELDSLSTVNNVDFPIKGIPQGHGESDTTATVDSTAQVAHQHFDYVHHAQHEISVVKDKLKRMTRNTNQDVQNFGKKQLVLASELYTQIGGKEEAHGHH
ncbi:hypothetical protein [Sphingobacterium bovistauri]|uniref:DUF4142 domain-containing protein n=1 Tax=Sphingobacterium bovistauri TaxID=2781959 RepID=A0ABS7Z563_9SPHI|nr:hypothetical protein [Sphingobacterium bovistauri]MCA5005284.1 hypothetical protein [Sphingobacterium bovistauri]